MTPSPRAIASSRDLSVLARDVLAWYQCYGRGLPWRETRDPYRIWISEAMLQQTTVKAVVPYYARFLRRFPSVAALARAPLPDVLAAWSGLGYYRRARHLKAAAERIRDAHGGRLPGDAAELRRLPGFGRYMAAAVASIAFDRPEPPVDANVRRLGARLFAIHDHGPRLDRAVAEKLRPLFLLARPSDLTQALLDLGATVCVPSAPRCNQCPVAWACRGRGSPERYAAPRPRALLMPRVAVAIARLHDADVYMIERRDRELEGMWDLPVAEGKDLAEARARLTAMLLPTARRAARGPASFVIRHTIMARRIARHVIVEEGRAAPARGALLVPLHGADGRPLSSAARKTILALRMMGA